ncbi:type III-B CRISPR module RAMP protein Cmr4 [Salinivibrio sp. SS2]|uniref:type III-B CRISPR module RAMP protein Cmr4 n=1 Tax=Salinivibrio sp. SS2 TaxID=1892894 RepID=UPI00084C500F|nr:type III-B CRISPR module RAMP protein Cmr4 [Salinivibrio sp. DV]ODQ01431.1 type III-B CRISPR module RAMP protein Cmr4 [Salinivibrio sp. DV]
MSFHVYHLFSHTILHCGAGQSVGIVDQPIARERASYLPIVPGSTVRGVLKAHVSDTESVAESSALQGLTYSLFGASTSNDGRAGALSITDAHLLLLPVRTVYGILAYATCPFILQRYKQDRELDFSLPMPSEKQALCPNDNPNHQDNVMVLEDLDLDAQTSGDVEPWAKDIAQCIYPDNEELRESMRKRIVVLPDTVFSFLAETATEIRTRIRINETTGVVDNGALWSEESLPAESILWGVYSVDHNRCHEQYVRELNHILKEEPLLQMGGNMGTGSGLVQFISLEDKGE